MKHNDKQLIAIDEKNKNIILSAAAGSGKTRVLVDKIMMYLLDKNSDVTLQNICIMTFTIKATNEMRERIKLAIDKELKNENLDNDIRKKLVRENAKIQNANISTIDSFCKKLLEQNYKLLADNENSLYSDFDPLYRIADEKELAIIYDDVLDEFLEEKFSETENEANKEFLRNYIEKGRDTRLREMFLKGIYFMNAIPWPRDFFIDIKNNFNKCCDAAYNDAISYSLSVIIKFGKRFSSFQNEINILKKAYENSRVANINDADKVEKIELAFDYLDLYEKFANKCATNSIKISDIEKFATEKKKFEEYLGSSKFLRYSKAMDIDKDIFSTSKDKINNDTYKKLNERIDLLLDEISITDDIKYYENEKIFIDYLIEFYDLILAKKKSKNVYSISDYQALVLDILYKYKVDKKDGGCAYNDREPNGIEFSDFVTKSNDKLYKYIFIDEYQDTSIIQEYILKAISNGFTDKNVFMVGDKKQSIYGFRNAEIKNFNDKFSKYKERNDYTDNDEGIRLTLDENYRSSKNIISFVNYIFSNAMDNDYENMISHDVYSDDKTDQDTVKNITNFEKENVILSIIENNEIDNKNIGLSHPEDIRKVEVAVIKESVLESDAGNVDDDAEKSVRLEAIYVAKRIKELINIRINGEQVYHYKDITILMRSIKSKALVFAEVFSEYDIPCFAEQKKGFYNRYEIKFMIDFLSIIDNPLQNIPFASVMTSNVFAFNDMELAFLKIIGINYKNENKEKKEEKEEKGNENEIELYKIIKLVRQYKDDVKIDGLYDEYKINKNEFIEKVDYLYDAINYLQYRANFLSIAELINIIYERYNVLNIMFAMKDGRLRKLNLKAFYENARNYEKSSNVGLFNFIRFIEKMRERDDDQGMSKLFDENDDVVNIMSIHASKGLEFNVVFLCQTHTAYNEKDTQVSENFMFDKDYGVALKYYDRKNKFNYPTPKEKLIANKKKDLNRQEELRMLYVALTRAKKKLFITAFAKKDKIGNVFSVADYEKFKNKEIDIDIDDSKRYIEIILKMFVNNDFVSYYLDEVKDYKLDTNDTSRDFSEKENRFIESIDLIKSSDYSNEIKKLDDDLSSKYKYKDLSYIKPKYSVSEIKGYKYELKVDDENTQDTKKYDSEVNNSIELGNAYHRYMQFYNFESGCYDVKYKDSDIEKNVESLVDKGKIKLLCENIVGITMANGYKNKTLFREQKFMKLFSINEIKKITNIDNLIPNKNLSVNVIDERNVIIQGIIDAFVIEKDENGKDVIVLIDYKTDRLNKSNEYVSKEKKDELKNKLINNYKIQLDIYEKALTDITNLKVAKKYIYSFALDSEILID